MDIDVSQLTVTHNEEGRRFEIRLDEHLALIDYTRAEGRIIYSHTEVPPVFEGKGIGSKLARAALDYARDNDLKVVPTCWFIAGYIERHPEYQPLVWQNPQ